MDWNAFEKDHCAVGAAIDVLGDRASLFVLREAFLGVRRFAEMQRNTGLARNILADRLQRLVGHGILERREYQQRPRRFEYRLTEKGLDLYPILVGLMIWGQKHAPGPAGPLVVMQHKACGAVVEPVLACPECGERLTARDVRALPGPGAALRESA